MHNLAAIKDAMPGPDSLCQLCGLVPLIVTVTVGEAAGPTSATLPAEKTRRPLVAGGFKFPLPSRGEGPFGNARRK